jgi:hypothetical protein
MAKTTTKIKANKQKLLIINVQKSLLSCVLHTAMTFHFDIHRNQANTFSNPEKRDLFGHS